MTLTTKYPITLDECYIYNPKEMKIIFTINGKASYMEFMDLLKNCGLVDMSQVLKYQEEWFNLIKKENEDSQLRLKAMDCIRRILPSLKLRDVKISGNSNPFIDHTCEIYYTLNTDGTDMSFKQMKDKLHSDKELHDQLDLYVFEFHPELDETTNAGYADIMIKPISFGGYKFKEIPMKISEGDGKYEDKGVWLVNEELDLRIRRTPSLYVDLLKYIQNYLLDSWGSIPESRMQVWKKYLERS